MLQEPGAWVRFPPARLLNQRRSSVAEHRKPSGQTFVDRFHSPSFRPEPRSTAGVEYMESDRKVERVQIPPRPLHV